MSEEQKPAEPKQNKRSSAILVLGCTLTALAIATEGPLQWILYVVAIAILLYAAILAGKERKPNPG